MAGALDLARSDPGDARRAAFQKKEEECRTKNLRIAAWAIAIHRISRAYPDMVF